MDLEGALLHSLPKSGGHGSSGPPGSYVPGYNCYGEGNFEKSGEEGESKMKRIKARRFADFAIGLSKGCVQYCGNEGNSVLKKILARKLMT